MGESSKIQWTHHTWSPWRGCAKVSPGCTNCYAEKLSHRNPATLGEWGPNGKRAVSRSWDKPLAWDRQASRQGTRSRVFPSLCDWLEDRDDLAEPRLRFLDLIRATSGGLDWLLLTKRPEKWSLLLKCASGLADLFRRPDLADWIEAWLAGKPPCNAWFGVSVENQEYADRRIPELLKVPAAVRFLSGEPLLGPIDLGRWLGFQHEDEVGIENPDQGLPRDQGVPFHDPWVRGPDWVIVGGESGSRARPCDLAWVRSIRDQCQEAGVACFVKQLGSRPESTSHPLAIVATHIKFTTDDPKGGDIAEFPEDLRIREFPTPTEPARP